MSYPFVGAMGYGVCLLFFFSGDNEQVQLNPESPSAGSFSRVDGSGMHKVSPLLCLPISCFRRARRLLRPSSSSMAAAGQRGTRDWPDMLMKPFPEHGSVAMYIDYDLSPGVRFAALP